MVREACFVGMPFINRLADKYGRQVGKYECLNGSDEQLQEKHEYRKRERYRRETPSGYRTQGAKDKDH